MCVESLEHGFQYLFIVASFYNQGAVGALLFWQRGFVSRQITADSVDHADTYHRGLRAAAKRLVIQFKYRIKFGP